MVAITEYKVHLRRPHRKQEAFIRSPAKRKVARAGRRSGKTSGVAVLAVEEFLASRRILYATPTADQLTKFWWEITEALAEPIEAGIYVKNETRHTVELMGTEQRIRAKTAWNADTLRGDYADLLILDEWQLMNEDAWELVGAPMLLDNNGNAIFIYTPPSLHSRSTSKARDPLHAAHMYKLAAADTSGRWAAFHWTSHDNPYISVEALAGITQDMTALAIRQEIEAEDLEEVPGALWKMKDIRYGQVPDTVKLVRVVIGVDPSGTATGDEQGIIVAAKGSDNQGYILADRSCRQSPKGWATEIATAYTQFKADRIVAEANFGGEMVESTIHTVNPHLPVTMVSASRGKAVRAEPIAALYEQGRIIHCGPKAELEEQLITWTPEDRRSPDRLDALVWALTTLFPPASGNTGVFGGERKDSPWRQR